MISFLKSALSKFRLNIRPLEKVPPKRNLMWKIKIQGITLLEGNTKKGDIKKSFLFHSLYNIMKGIIMVLSKFKDIVLFFSINDIQKKTDNFKTAKN